MRRWVTESIGTFFLVLTIGMVSTSGSDAAPLAIGAALMVMVYMGGHVSGAHYNPAVTIAIRLRGAMEPSDVLPYIAAQLVGALLASATVFLLTGATFGPAPGAGAGVGQVLLAEAIVTFALALVVLNVATAPTTKGNSFYGLAIGLTVMAGAYAIGPISGGAFNPAVSIGPSVIGALADGDSVRNIWLYVVGPVAGAMAAAPVYRLQNSTSD
jgi:aquaporin Z